MISILSVNSYSFANENEWLENQEEVDEFVNSELGTYLSGFGYEEGDELYLSEGFDVYEEDGELHSSIYFLFEEDEIVGEVSTTEIDGEKVSCFIYGEFDEVEEVFNKEEEVCFISSGENIIMATEEEAVSISGENQGDTFEVDEITVENAESNIIEKQELPEDVDLASENAVEIVDSYDDVPSEAQELPEDVELVSEDAVEVVDIYDEVPAEAYNTSYIEPKLNIRSRTFIKNRDDSTTYNYRFLSVKFRKNFLLNGGICWAASGASIINYRLLRSHKTMDVFNTLNNKYIGTPVGNMTWVNRMWSTYGVSMYYVSSKLAYSSVFNQLSAGRPIYCYFARASNSSTIDSAHAVVLCGTYIMTSTGNYCYVYMDPNTAAKKQFVVNVISKDTVNTSIGTKFYYYNGYKLYNNWGYTYY